MIRLFTTGLAGACTCLGFTFGCFAETQTAKVEPAARQFAYFRSDGGVARSDCGLLPQDFSEPGALLWKVGLDSGQSTPVLCNGKVFLTTYRSETKELATVALDSAKGGA